MARAQQAAVEQATVEQAAVEQAAVEQAAVEQVLVTGSYTPQTDLTSSIYVLDASRIERLNKRTLAGLLRTVPGLLVEEQGGPGGLTAVSIRGGEANFTLVMLDGVALNDPTNSRGGGFDVANLDASQIDRIEVVRGAQSAIYGSDALAGVINIVTTAARDGHRQVVTVSAGEDEFRDAALSLQGKHERFDYRLALSTRDDGEPVAGSERENDSAQLKLGWRLNDRHSLRAQLRYLQGDRSSFPEQSGGPEFALTDELDIASYENQIAALSWRALVAQNWTSSLAASRFEHDEDFDSPGISPFLEVPPNGARTEFVRDDLRWVNSIALAPHSELDVGGDYRREKGTAQGYVAFFGDRTATDFALDRDTLGLFASLSASPSARTLINASVRYDDPEGFASETSWRFGVNFSASSALTLSANWGQAYKLPSFFALGNALVGNPDLQPEKAIGTDVGVTWIASNALSMELTLFHNDFRDLVDFDDESFRNVNRGQVETRGAEWAATYAPQDDLTFIATGTYTDIDVREDTILTGRPQWSAGLSTLWQVAAAWDTSLDYRYTGQQWSTSRHTGEAVSQQLDDYHRLDWVLRWQASSRWHLRLSVDNLLNTHYDTAVGFAAPGRLARFGLQLEI